MANQPNMVLRWINYLKGQMATAVLVSATGGTITAKMALAQGGAVVTNAGASAAVTFALPAAKPGMKVTAIVKVAQELRLDPNLTETVAVPSTGVQGAAGKYIGADAIGESAVYICTVAGTWDHVGPIDGTWTIEA